MSLDFTKVTYVDGETVIGADNLNDIQDAILALDERTEEENPNVLVAVYGTTTFDTLMSAYNDGKTIFARDSETDYNLSDITRQDDTVTAFQFSSFRVIDGTKYLYTCECDATNAWSSEVQQIELSEELLEPVEQTIKPTTIGPAAIATFDASAADMPLKGLTVDIEPVQDLHGYDHPWPGGGGKNLWPFGDISTSMNGEPFSLKAGTYNISCNPISGDSLGVRFFYVDGDTSQSLLALMASNNSYSTSFTLTSDVVSINVARGVSSQNTFTGIQLESGSQKTSFSPYSNICPISGWTGAKVTHYGANLLDGVNINRGVYVTASGNEQTSATDFSSTDYVPISDDVSILTNFPSQITAAISVAYYDASKVFISRQFVYGNGTQLPPVGPASEKLVLPTDAKWLRVNCYYNEFAHVAISEGDIDNFNVTFPSPDPGTVYGGTLTINADSSGELMVDRAITILNGSENWQMQSTYQYGFYYDNAMPRAAIGTIEGDARFVCNKYKISEAIINSSALPDKENVTVFNQTNIADWYKRAWVKDTSYTGDLAGFKASLAANNLQIVYPLATPIVYDLTDIPEITTLLGTNNIWADCGDVTVTYGAYLETVKAHAERLGDSILSAIAPLEASYTASRTYAVGSYLFVGTKFYKVTAAIGSGDTINPGTNVTQTTVAAQLMEFNTLRISSESGSIATNAGEYAFFTVNAVGGTAPYTYKWSVSTDGGDTWRNTTANGYGTNTLYFKVASSYNGFMYRCNITDGNGNVITSTPVTLTIVS